MSRPTGRRFVSEMRVYGIDDRLQPPTGLFAFVAVRRHVAQGAPDRLPVTFQQIGRSEGGEEFHVGLTVVVGL